MTSGTDFGLEGGGGGPLLGGVWPALSGTGLNRAMHAFAASVPPVPIRVATVARPPLSAGARALRSSAIRDLLRLTEAPHVLSMAGGVPAGELLPLERLSEAFEAVVGRAGRRALQYGPTEGVAELRGAVAAGLWARPEEVLVTTGSQQGLDLAVRTLVGPGDVVVTEAPSYLGALQVATLAGARIEAVPPAGGAPPADAEGAGADTGNGLGGGLDVEALERRLRAGLRPALCYVVPEFANPTGATLASDRRTALVALARRYGFVVVEDDPYGALRFRGVATPSLRQLGPDVVVGLRSASKTLAPGLRVGWLAAPTWLHGPLVRAKQAADLHTAGLNQLVVAELLADDRFVTAHLALLRAEYAGRQSALVRALADRLAAPLRWSVPDGGLFLWVRLAAAGR
ncbi:MAG: PLP-dependent aminotransferase family protein, partial [Acidimicrobiales bacterium]|nr:PLP-dependent aminotransferase family protein [Acidimicrobiales bacterium]